MVRERRNAALRGCLRTPKSSSRGAISKERSTLSRNHVRKKVLPRALSTASTELSNDRRAEAERIRVSTSGECSRDGLRRACTSECLCRAQRMTYVTTCVNPSHHVCADARIQRCHANHASGAARRVQHVFRHVDNSANIAALFSRARAERESRHLRQYAPPSATRSESTRLRVRANQARTPGV